MSKQVDSLDPQCAGVRIRWGIKIAVRDGVYLSATLYLPSHHTTPSPVIVTLTPYIAQMYHDRGLYFAAHGYPFVSVDVRGRGNSGGDFSPLIQESRDGHDVVEWLARQSYCNGQVAMWGGSYGGYVQWATAKEFPPHLTTIVPVAAAYLAVDFPMRNNIASPYAVQWLTLVAGRTSQERMFFNNERFWRTRYFQWLKSGSRFKDLDSFLGLPSAVFQEWAAHPHQDSYWDHYNPTASEYRKLCLPILTITGMYDSDQPGALQYYRQHVMHGTGEPQHYLIIGPWDHAGTRAPQAEFCGVEAGPESLIDLGKLHLEWYAWTMLGGPKPNFLQDNVAYYVTGANKWRYAHTLEAITGEYRLLYLDSDGAASSIFASGLLCDEPGRGDEDMYIYNPRDTRTLEVEAAATDPFSLRPTFPADNVQDQALVFAAEGSQLVYHSAQFETDTEISGFFKLVAWIAINQPDTDLRATVYEIGPDGVSILLTSDCIRARYREGLREPNLIQTSDPLRYEFDSFTFASREIKKGSRLRLVVGPINSIFFEKNYNSGGVVSEETLNDARSVQVKLFHNVSYPSALYVPLGQPEFAEQEWRPN